MQKIKYFKDIDFIKNFDIQHKETIFKPKTKEDWDKKVDKLIDCSYYNKFISKINMEDIETVLDVGCGNGILAIKF